MQEYMLRILNNGDVKSTMSKDEHLAFVKACEKYIGGLKAEGKLIAAQPLVREGVTISGTPGTWKEETFNKSLRVQVGYYHIRAESMEDAVAIAKRNPEFAFSDKASIEVRPIKGTEKTTGFVYPKGDG